MTSYDAARPWQGAGASLESRVRNSVGAVMVACLAVVASGLDSITPSPGAMGPNALPVPNLHYPSVDDDIRVTLAADGYYDPRGDRTVNPYLHLSIPLRGIAEFIIFARPVEVYRTSESMRALRNARDTSGSAKGDVYFQTMIQVLRQQTTPVDMALNVTIKTTTGKSRANARHLDAPAYFFDLTSGRTLYRGARNLTQVRAAGVVSFIAWQTDVAEQNDALGYGMRIEGTFGSAVTCHAEAAGYVGWQENGDRPAVLRGGVLWRVSQSAELFGLCQYGLNDQPPYAVKIGACFRLPVTISSPSH